MDTNVGVVANGMARQAGPGCVAACITPLEAIRKHQRIVLDDQGDILDEYRRHLHPSGQPGPGDAFFKWLWSNQADARRCVTVAVVPDPGRGYCEFPDSPALTDFDRDDRKFVAVARAVGTSPPILNASDSDWWHYRRALQDQGVSVEHLCPESMPNPAPAAVQQ